MRTVMSGEDGLNTECRPARWALVTLTLMIGALTLVPSVVRAQGSPTGTLTGVIADTSGGVLPGVTVIATNMQTGLTQQTVSEDTGDWRLAALPAGTYQISFELDGFKKLVRSGVNVEAAVTRSVPVSLEVGGLTETVQVTADAALLSVTTSATSRRLSGAGARGRSDIDRELYAPAVVGGRCERGSCRRCSLTEPAIFRPL